MKVAIHQPNYLPWIGYFYKMYLSEVFVFHDGVAYTKRGYTKRVKVKKDRYGDELRWLSVPIRHAHQSTLISELEIDDTKDWFLAHQRKLYYAYGNSDYYIAVMSMLESVVLENPTVQLSVLNQHLIKAIARYLDITPRFVMGSSLDVDGHKSDININIIHAVGGDMYISGTGANKYQSVEEYLEEGLSFEIADIATFLKSSEGIEINHKKAIIGASIFDWLMRYSPEEVKAIFISASHS